MNSLKAFLAILLVFAVGSTSYAVDWTLNGDGGWTNDSNWSAAHPNGVGAVADFSTIDITGSRSVTLHDHITVGTMRFGDTTGAQNYTFYTGTVGSVTFDNGGSGCLIDMTSGGNVAINGINVILNDDLVITNTSGASIQCGSHVSYGNTTITGTGGITVVSGYLGLNGASMSAYTGQIIITNDAVVMFYSTHSQGNVTVSSNGLYRGYYIYTMSRNLGTGTKSLRFTGGPGTVSGFGWNNNMTVKFNNNANTVVQWGGGHFDMETFRLENTGGTTKVIDFQNILDLNGGDRTIRVVTTSDTTNQFAKFTNEIRDTAGGGSLIKTGNGRLLLTDPNTYDGDTTVSEGILELQAANTNGENAAITIADGATLILNFAGSYTNEWLYTGDTMYYAGEFGHTDSGADNGGLGVGALDAYFGAGSGKLITTGKPAGTVFIIK